MMRTQDQRACCPKSVFEINFSCLVNFIRNKPVLLFDNLIFVHTRREC